MIATRIVFYSEMKVLPQKYAKSHTCIIVLLSIQIIIIDRISKIKFSAALSFSQKLKLPVYINCVVRHIEYIHYRLSVRFSALFMVIHGVHYLYNHVDERH